MHYMNWFGGGWLMMGFWWAIFIGTIYLVMKSIEKQTVHTTQPESALEILKKRLARGEISKDEYEVQKLSLI